MKKGQIYNEEKVLYFADSAKGLHVCHDESKRDTDLSRIRDSLCSRGLITEVADDDSGLYYRATKAGERRLLELQIAWRNRHGKDVSSQEKRLAAIQ